ncbi:MAG: hypothetical protein IPH31_26085 [Lewinellaceae bacterium]|nr:hypothetical protein [Lewinellaceae bacterium]
MRRLSRSIQAGPPDKNEQVIGDFESRKAARLVALKLHKPGTFIIHHCVEEKASLAPRLYGRQLVTIDKK